MPAIGIILAFVIVISAGIIRQFTNVPAVVRPEIAADSDSVSARSETLTPTVIPAYTIIIPSVIATPALQSDDITFLYPGAKVQSTDGDTQHSISSDTPDTVIDWYKSKIKSADMKTTASAVTNTNGNILAKIAGSGKNSTVDIEVSGTTSDRQTNIIVRYVTY